MRRAIVAGALAALAIGAQAQSLFREDTFRGLTADNKAYRPGDVLTAGAGMNPEPERSSAIRRSASKRHPLKCTHAGRGVRRDHSAQLSTEACRSFATVRSTSPAPIATAPAASAATNSQPKLRKGRSARSMRSIDARG